jgi:hypothetical protein
LITHPIPRIWPRRTTACSLDWNKQFKGCHFYPTRRSLLSRRTGWTDNLLNFIFWMTCRSWSNGLRSVLNFVGSMLNKSWVLSLWLFFLSGRAKDLSAPLRTSISAQWEVGLLKDNFQIYKISDKLVIFFVLICLCLYECRWQHEQSSER